MGAFKLVLRVPVGPKRSGEPWLTLGYAMDILLVASATVGLLIGKSCDSFLLSLILVSLGFLTMGYVWLFWSRWRQRRITPQG